MIKLYLILFFEFSKIGVFAIGGGYATIPFLFHIQEKYNWFSINELTNMIAVSNLTPGPVGINMATYTGFKTAGIIGSIICTVAMLVIPFVLTLLIARLFVKFRDNFILQAVFKGLRPAACALLASIAITLLAKTLVMQDSLGSFVLDYKLLTLFILLMLPFSFFKKNPLITILFGAFGGILINIF